MNRKRMRNVFMIKIDNILMEYYKEISFQQFNQDEEWNKSGLAKRYGIEAMKNIDLMKELDLLTSEEFILLKEVYSECFTEHDC